MVYEEIFREPREFARHLAVLQRHEFRVDGRVVYAFAQIGIFSFKALIVEVAGDAAGNVRKLHGVRLEDDVFVGPDVSFSNDPRPRSGVHLAEHPRTSVRAGAADRCGTGPGAATGGAAGHGAAETFGDYLAGSSHVLPTDGAARAWSALSRTCNRPNSRCLSPRICMV